MTVSYYNKYSAAIYMLTQSTVTRLQPKNSFDPNSAVQNTSTQERAKQVFGQVGSRDASRAEAEAKARTVGGVKVPAKPEEPTNCCMSGCINCVWEQFKDELEDWQYKRQKAKDALLTTHTNSKWPVDFGPEPDRTGTNAQKYREKLKKTTEITEDESGWEDIDMSIRVFVETEKMLREKKRRKKQQQQQQQVA